DNTEQQRFEIDVDGHIAFEDYEFFTTSQGEKGIDYKHTEVPEALGGRGIAGYLVKTILDDAAAKHLRVKPTCPYVKAYIDKHPEYQ
ncbi:GNAT family N-acetyltransferase, partial [Pseudomonas sp. HY2-MNA-CIBAN-0224]